MEDLGSKASAFYAERFSAVWVEQLPRALALFALLIAIYFVVRRGHRRWTWRASWGALATVILINLNLFLGPFRWLAEARLERAYGVAELPQIPASFWEGVPTWALVVLGVLAKDFVDYWNHRLMHCRWLWPIHSVHHSDPDVGPLTAFRVHELEGFLMAVSYLFLLTWLNLPTLAVGGVALVFLFHNMYVHTPFDWDHGPLRYVITSPRYHFWHHADVPEAYGKNLANLFPFYDVLFGTYYCPGPVRDVPLGAEGVPQHNPIALFLFPLVLWLRYLRESVAAGLQRLRTLLGLPTDDSTPTPDEIGRVD